ncbi:glycosyltransferase [Rhodohalobacter sp. SW132]|uniref:glycosyltransferase n=1 Tax=Rhodohalobacter sp. SW132 TaxID=2293433 RepID=UPI000E2386CF|nr:glycosyltransferase [Rhodohalobacter sp. SW132]REL24731.1 glycosyltransferase [Rhodohalobacter sp. SW132]
MNSKRKILFLLPSLRGGGAERTLINLLHKIDYDRYEVDLVVVSKHGVYVNEVPPEVEVTYLFKNHLLVRVLGYLNRTFRVSWFFKKKMAALTKEYDLGVSFLDSNYTDLLFLNEKIEKRVAFVHGSYLTHSNYEKFYRYEKHRKWLKNNRYSNLDGIYFVSRDSMSDFIELFGEFPEMGVVYNLIDKKAVIQKSEAETGGLKFDKFTFSAVGSLMPIKGFDRLVRAAKIVKDQGYDFRLYIAGTGEEEQNLKELIHEHKLEGTVELLGFMKNPYPLMKNSDVFLMSSVSEALPTVLCESMILGVPALVTNCSGCRGLVEEGEYGLMAEQDDRDYAEKMMHYMDQPDLLSHYSRKSSERTKLFDDEQVLKTYQNIFDGKEAVPA